MEYVLKEYAKRTAGFYGRSWRRTKALPENTKPRHLLSATGEFAGLLGMMICWRPMPL